MGPLGAFIRVAAAILVVATGIFVAVAMAIVAAILVLIRRPRASTARFSSGRSRAFPNPTGDVIDVTATEVSVEPAKTA